MQGTESFLKKNLESRSGLHLLPHQESADCKCVLSTQPAQVDGPDEPLQKGKRFRLRQVCLEDASAKFLEHGAEPFLHLLKNRFNHGVIKRLFAAEMIRDRGNILPGFISNLTDGSAFEVLFSKHL